MPTEIFLGTAPGKWRVGVTFTCTLEIGTDLCQVVLRVLVTSLLETEHENLSNEADRKDNTRSRSTHPTPPTVLKELRHHFGAKLISMATWNRVH